MDKKRDRLLFHFMFICGGVGDVFIVSSEDPSFAGNIGNAPVDFSGDCFWLNGIYPGAKSIPGI